MNDAPVNVFLGRIESAKAFLRVPRSEPITLGVAVDASVLERPGSANLRSKEMFTLLQQRIVLTPQLIDLGIRFLEHFEFYARNSYSSSEEFLRRLHMSDRQLAGLRQDVLPICLTGLSGVGKSTFVRLLVDLLTVEGLAFNAEVGSFPVSSIDMLEVGDRTKASTVLAGSWLYDDQLVSRAKRTIDDYGRMVYAKGLLAFGVDEVQFTSASGSANSQVTKILLGLVPVGLPWFYVGNYSLLWRLVRRNQEDMVRLLTNRAKLEPLILDSDDADDYVKTLFAGLESYFDVKDDGFRRLLVTRAGGMQRNIANLASQAFQLSQTANGGSRVTSRYIEMAYKSDAYAVSRKDVEALRKSTDWRKSNGRLDLIYPFGSDENLLNASRQQQLMADEVLHAALTKSERSTMKVDKSSEHKPSVWDYDDSDYAALNRGLKNL